MKSIRVKAVHVDFIETCVACPEQYDVFIEGKEVGYVRLRWGRLSVRYPCVGGKEVYTFDWVDPLLGEFETDDERDYHLEQAAKALYNEYSKCEVPG